jgi:hypothetical protein
MRSGPLWDAAYASQRKAEPPPDLPEALAAKLTADRMLGALTTPAATP